MALVVAGCGEEGAEPAGPTVALLVTEDFGRESVGEHQATPLKGHETVMRLLEGHHDVGKTPDGRDVMAVDGRRSRPDPPGERNWVLNVNGVEADEVASEYRVHPGDLVQWDLRDWYVTLDVRATVGAFPETFTRGVFGGRFPVVVECERPRSPACRTVRRALARAGVRVGEPVPPGRRPPEFLPQRARILVGEWRRWRDREPPSRVDHGPRYSGVFARFSPDGRELRMLDWNAHRAGASGAGTGLVAALRPTEEALLWLVTGVDQAGVERAARALDSRELRGAFAVAVTPAGIEKLPLPPR